MFKFTGKFQRQLTEARRKNEALIENLRHTYEEEVEQLKGNRGELQSLCKELEKQISAKHADLEIARTRMSSMEKDYQLRQEVRKCWAIF